MESVCTSGFLIHISNRQIICSPYERETAVYPLPYLRDRKFWPSVSRVDDGTDIALNNIFQLPDNPS